MRDYEAIFILDPQLDGPKGDEELAKIKDAIAKTGGEVGRYEAWGKKALAYSIMRRPRKFSEGVYHFMEVKIEPSQISKLNRTYRLDESIVRHMFVRKED